MEAFERSSAEPQRRSFLISSYQQLKKKISSVDPTTLCYPEKLDSHFLETPIEWRIGIDLFTMRPIAVPASIVFCPYFPPPQTASLTHGFSSTGLASGNTLLEAIVHGLLEVIERHAISPGLSEVKIHAIRPEEISNRYITTLLRKLKKHGISIGLKYYKTGCEITVCRASIDDPITRDPHLLCYGSGCHLSRDVAIIRALTEAVQTRLTVISGTREDMELHEDLRQDPFIYDELCKEFWHYFELKDPLSYSELPHFQHSTFREDLVLILKKLKRYGYRQAIAVNLTRSDLNIPVVRVVVPKLPIQLQPHDFLSKAAKNARDRRKD
jgi:thioglycine synthase